ncbi:sugar phosphate isomerase/epimerase family protein [Maribacter hydrothermalis]|uniref:Xylose isomerase n=1 Tax=Maribacter hydrothermalis TaxID=1836467 RepID=A0A1B7ZEX9_9FLAO|nr:sugar phosphate isomerase/epimerase family protein [Maribacter hydrothermalis]APQ17517.1 xylose isomerase [Maribacter hydrothermalis]OBR41992.1 xylose isomerase [Maribacter hydrothermalis]
MKSKKLIRIAFIVGIGISLLGTYACKENKKEKVEEIEIVEDETNTAPFFELSLAQWSMHKMINDEGVDPYSFAEKAKNWGFTGLEYVSQLYNPELSDANYSEEAMANFVEKSNAEAKKYGMKNVLIMIDGQGNLAVNDEAERNETVEKHKKWVDAAAAMGCHAIRVNLNGSNVPEEWIKNSVDGLTKLATYAKTKNINILVENHGGLSSNGELHAQVMKNVNMDNCGSLPDFGNFCMERKPNSWDCLKEYDKYKGVKELMPYAKAVSAKSNNFDADGYDTGIDYVQMLKIVKDAGYTGFIGVEYEGSEISEEAGIIATRDLLLKAANEIE